MPQRLRRSSPWLNRSGAEGYLKELNGRTPAKLTRYGTSARSTRACRRHLRPHRDRRVVTALRAAGDLRRAPTKIPQVRVPDPPPQVSHGQDGIPRHTRALVVKLGLRCPLNSGNPAQMQGFPCWWMAVRDRIELSTFRFSGGLSFSGTTGPVTADQPASPAKTPGRAGKPWRRKHPLRPRSPQETHNRPAAGPGSPSAPLAAARDRAARCGPAPCRSPL
jgi:hypothetical protein